jgi:signal transduction histidine kinase
MTSDRRRIEQILLNLLNNAIKFTEHGEVVLTLEPIAAAHATSTREMVKITVRDTGIGMKSGDCEQLFRPFRQIDTGLQRQHEGTGLGLAICRRLAELLRGTIHVESEWGRGSVFTVTLPLQLEPAP